MPRFIIAEAMKITCQEVYKMAEKREVSTTLKWKAEVTFEGTPEQFQAFKADMEKHDIKIELGEMRAVARAWEKFPFHPAGYIPALVKDFFPKADQLAKLTQGATRMQFVAIKDIQGGIRTPHLHLGNEVVLLDKDRFKTILGEVARNVLEHRIESEEDYFNVIEGVTGLRT
jgi:hypothetical protein